MSNLIYIASSSSRIAYLSRRKCDRYLPFIDGRYNSEAREWRVVDVLCLKDHSNSHLACIMVDGAEANDQLRRSEVYCAVEFMMRSIYFDKRQRFAVNPVRGCFLPSSLCVTSV